MRTNLISLVAGVGLSLTAAVPALAHHSFAAEFDASKPVTIEGTVKEFRWVNPHSWLHINVTKPDGTVEEWAVEGGAVKHAFHADDPFAVLCEVEIASNTRTHAVSADQVARRDRARG